MQEQLESNVVLGPKEFLLIWEGLAYLIPIQLIITMGEGDSFHFDKHFVLILHVTFLMMLLLSFNWFYFFIASFTNGTGKCKLKRNYIMEWRVKNIREGIIQYKAGGFCLALLVRS